MTKEEFLKQYSGCVLVFKSYYKYCFTYAMVNSNWKVSFGGESRWEGSDIYRCNICLAMTVEELAENSPDEWEIRGDDNEK